MMLSSPKLLCALLSLSTTLRAANVVLSNDDGWAEINVRTFYDTLTAAGEDVVLSAPAENQSGTGSSDSAPTVRDDACQYDSCEPGSAVGSNASEPRLNWVNSYPVTSIKYGIQNLSATYGTPVFAVTGPNVGANLGLTVLISGTVGAATEAVKEGIPAVAFSGSSGDATAWNTTPVPIHSSFYADLATNVTQTLIASGTPYLPAGIYLNVNFPDVDNSTCSSASEVKFVLSRVVGAVPLVTPDDVETCGERRLPSESDVVGTDGCYASVSVGSADSKLDANATAQATVLAKLGGILSCLPS